MQVNFNKMYYKYLSTDLTNNNINPLLPNIIWGHGWGQSHINLLPLANSLKNIANHWLLDLPGFGVSANPDSTWGSNEYAYFTANWINNNLPNNTKKIWVGHSFGGKIGINLAANYPHLINGLFLIAASGIPKPRNIIKIIKVKTFKLLKYLCNNEKYINWLRNKFGSSDYKNANPTMRPILTKLVNENVSDLAKKIVCPTELLYGEYDTETPIIIAKKLHKLINNSKLHVIAKEDHYGVISTSKHQTIYLLKNFIKNIC